MKNRLIAALAVAALLWFYMFSPWTAGLTNFWLTMAASALILTSLAVFFSPEKLPKVEKPFLQILAGAIIAVFLWGVFWVGDRVSSLIFDFARPEVDSIYSMKDGMPSSACYCRLAASFDRPCGGILLAGVCAADYGEAAGRP